MNIFLFRHAEKAFSSSNNPPLSERGLAQSHALKDLVQSGKIQKPQILLCSPKLRTIQTLHPLSQLLNIEIQQLKELDERQSSENSEQYFQKVKSFISWLTLQNKNIFLVTHFDWIEEALTAIPCDTDLSHEKYHAWSSAYFMSFTIQGEFWHLNEFRGVNNADS